MQPFPACGCIDLLFQTHNKRCPCLTPACYALANVDRKKHHLSQITPIPHITTAGWFISQKFLQSTEGATLAGMLTTKVMANCTLVNADMFLKELKLSHTLWRCTHHGGKAETAPEAGTVWRWGGYWCWFRDGGQKGVSVRANGVRGQGRRQDLTKGRHQHRLLAVRRRGHI